MFFIFSFACLFYCINNAGIIVWGNSFHTCFYVYIFFNDVSIVEKKIIGAVEIYQHYMPEPFRRRCLCMPTCSEYMILVVKKHGVLKGLRKGINRLIHTCRGMDYKIDFP